MLFLGKMSRHRYLKSHELQAIIDGWSSDEEEIDQIVLCPPSKVDELTDDEDIDDEIMPNIDDNNYFEVAGEIEIETTEDFSGPQASQSNVLEPQPSTSTGWSNPDSTSSKRRRIASELTPAVPTYKPLADFGVPKWKKSKRSSIELVKYDKQPNHAPIEPEVLEIVTKLDAYTPLQLFFLFYDEAIFDLLVTETNRYYNQNNQSGELCTISQMKRFIGILLMSGYSTVPHISDYWSREPTLGRPIIRNAMSRKNFQKIKQYLHLANNFTIDTTDKFAKLAPYFKLLNNNFMQFGVFSAHLSIDEQMVPYYGKHSSKMYIRGKPIRFGYKLWCLCSSEGYLYQFIPYGGAGGFPKDIGLGAHTVLRLLSVVDNPIRHDVYFDNFFTSYYLMCLLSERHFFATGTVRVNRLAGATLKSGAKNLPRGAMDYSFDKTNKILIARWSDNKEVSIATNHQSIEPFAKARRYNKELKKKVDVDMPLVIAQYNRHMGGVDLHDNAVSNYRVAIRGKKWWWTLFTSGLNSSLVNAWKMHCVIAKHKHEKPLPQKDFKVIVTSALLTTDEPLNSDNDGDKNNDSSVGVSCTPVPNIAGRHLVERNSFGKHLRCKVCHKTTIYMCCKCNVHIHAKCFTKYKAHN